MKMWEIIVGIVLAAGCFFGGFFVRGEVAPKTVNQNTYVTQESDLSQQQQTRIQNIQASVTIIMDEKATNKFVSVKFFDLTNITISRESNHTTNWISNQTR